MSPTTRLSTGRVGFKTCIFCSRGQAIDLVLAVFAALDHTIEAVFVDVGTHHWIFGLLLIGYMFHLHDRSLHARFDALDKWVDELRMRLAVEY